MITSIFSKSRPFNYILVTVLMVCFFFVSETRDTAWTNSSGGIIIKTGCLLLLLFALFLTNFVTKRNGMSKDSTYPFLFYFVFLVFFPGLFSDPSLIAANFFVLLALRRLISLQSLITPKEKIFDASLWIFAAALFKFWCILYLLIVFISIIFHVSRDYRNWVIPFIALLSAGTIFVLCSLLFEPLWIERLWDGAYVDTSFEYFRDNRENLALSLYAAVSVLFFFAMLFSLGSKPLILHSSYKKILFSFVVGVAVFVLSPAKGNALLSFTYMPLAIMATSYIEGLSSQWAKEGFSLGVCLVAIACFVMQVGL